MATTQYPDPIADDDFNESLLSDDGTYVPLTERERFLAARRTGIGGSDVGAICGVDKYRSALDVYHEKLGLTEPTPDTGHTKRGRKLEAVAATEYTEVSGRKLRRVNRLLRHPEHPYLIGHIDRKLEGERVVAEIKCPSLGSFAKIKREGLDESKILQMQHYLMVTGYEAGEWVIFCADQWELLRFPVHADHALHERLVPIEREFWTCVERREPPIQAEDGAPRIEVEAIGGEIVRRNDEAYGRAAEMLREAATLKQQGELLYDAAKAQMLDAIGNTVGHYEGAGVRLHYTEQAGRVTFDKKALAKAHPTLDLAPFEKAGKPFTVFKPVFLGEES